MINELLIDGNNMEVFSKLIPKQYQNEIEKDRITALGFIDDEAMAGERIVGVVLVRRFDRWIEIEYMSQSDMHPGEFYATEIIEALIERLRTSTVDYAGIFTRIYPNETEKYELFDSVGFDFCKATDGIYEFNFDMVDMESLLGTVKIANKCLKLRDAGSELMSEVERMLRVDPRALPLAFPIATDEYDQDMSMIYKDENSCGILLCSIHDDYMMIDTLVSQGPKSTGALLGALYMYYEKNYDHGMTISIPVINQEAKMLVKHIVPDAQQKEITVGCYYF